MQLVHKPTNHTLPEQQQSAYLPFTRIYAAVIGKRQPAVTGPVAIQHQVFSCFGAEGLKPASSPAAQLQLPYAAAATTTTATATTIHWYFRSHSIN